MTINEEKVDFPKAEASYSNLEKDDINLLISLLGEYSEKLIRLCAKIEENKQKKSLLDFVLGIIVITLSTISIIPIIISFRIYTYFSILGTLIFSIFMLYLTIPAYYIRKKIKISEREAKKMSSRLEKVIRIASQIQDHFSSNRRRSVGLKSSIPLVISGVELDLRLADAESALEYYQVIVGK
jgi:hypothetical protein